MTIKPWFAKAVRCGIEQAKQDVADYGERTYSPLPFLTFDFDRNSAVSADAHARMFERLINARLNKLTEAEVKKLNASAAYWRSNSAERKYRDVQNSLERLEARVKVLESI